MQQLLSFLDLTGEPSLVSTSGFRCAKHNSEVGGTMHSLHLAGRAIDLAAETVREKTVILDAFHHSPELKGLGLGSNFIHIDNRTEPASWTYPQKS